MIQKIKAYIKNQTGQALVMVLVLSVVGVLIVGAGVILSALNLKGTLSVDLSSNALYMAESGLETGTIRLIRNPSYTGEVLNMNGGTVTITVSGTSPKTITSTAVYAGITKTVTLNATQSNGAYTFSSWSQQ